MLKKRTLLETALVVALAWACSDSSPTLFIRLVSTTSTENSGLIEYLRPHFPVGVHLVTAGTGQALEIARNGDVDVLLVHHQPAEERFVAEGFGVERFDVMYNDFVIVGPRDDPAQIGGTSDGPAALAKIAAARSPFASRGDDSGTSRKERSLWELTDVDVDAASGDWYRETGSGMGATLNAASAMKAYALTDRATWLHFANKGDLVILCEGDPRLLNQYGVTLVSPQKHPHVQREAGQRFVDWLISPEGQFLIASYKIGDEQAFFPNAALEPAP